jgi:subtilisin family serine protease
VVDPPPPVVDPLPPVIDPQPPVTDQRPPVINPPPFLPASITTNLLQLIDITRLVNLMPVLQSTLVDPAQIAQQFPSNPSTQTGPSNQQAGNTGNTGLRPDGRPSNVPPPNETRFVSDQVVVQIGATVSPQVLDAIARRLGLTVISSQTLGLLGTRVIQFHIGSGLSVRDVIVELEKNRIIDEAAPNYEFLLAQDSRTPVPSTAGDPAQYAIAKLRLAEAHRIARGDNVLVAVIDSEIDGKHPDIEGAIKARYEGAGPAEKAHPHGTGMAGAIASHRKLMGTAPGARILAIRAFGGPSGTLGTTVQIVQGLDWAVAQGARIVNMSFAGPKDPTLQKAFKAAFDQGIVLVAAAGNAGPRSPPLYPGADANVIAVSATDEDDKIYSNANRGKYVAVAAPGVDILVPAPDGNYEFTTGTSVAAAHVSGIAALLLQRDPKLGPAAVRDILTGTANNFGARGRNDEWGFGVVDPYRALLSITARSASVQGMSRRRN